MEKIISEADNPYCQSSGKKVPDPKIFGEKVG